MTYVVLDTETTNGFEDPFAYDIGWGVFCDGELLVHRSFVNADIFLDEPGLMKEAHFADKIPQYWDDIKSGKRELRHYYNIKKALQADCTMYPVELIVAHNMRFDYRSTAKTQRYLTTSKYRYFFPYGVPIWDSLGMARETIGKTDEYLQFCSDHDYICKNGTPRLTAEILYRYLSGNNDFEEAHTGFEDVQIENQIFMACLAINPEIDGRLWKD